MNRGRVVLAIAALAALLVVGCGSSSGDPEVTVQAGSLSKAEFTEKADAICKAARTEFLAKYELFLKDHNSEVISSHTTKAEQEALTSEIIESIVTPNFEGLITKISELGAPKAYAPEASAFLEALQGKLEKVQEQPAALGTTSFPFKGAEDAARRAGMYGCAESFG